MITVSVKQLVSAIEEADVFHLPDMTEGTRYLYDDIYRKLSGGNDVRLSELDFDRFELDDIESMRSLYSHTLEANDSKCEQLSRSLRGISPVAALSAFV
jgi:hypothetical protein